MLFNSGLSYHFTIYNSVSILFGKYFIWVKKYFLRLLKTSTTHVLACSNIHMTPYRRPLQRTYYLALINTSRLQKSSISESKYWPTWATSKIISVTKILSNIWVQLILNNCNVWTRSINTYSTIWHYIHFFSRIFLYHYYSRNFIPLTLLKNIEKRIHIRHLIYCFSSAIIVCFYILLSRDTMFGLLSSCNNLPNSLINKGGCKKITPILLFSAINCNKLFTLTTSISFIFLVRFIDHTERRSLLVTHLLKHTIFYVLQPIFALA